MAFNVLLEELIESLGGCGLFQWIISLLVHFGKTCITWSMLTMTFAAQTPKFWCINMSNETTTCFVNGTERCESFHYEEYFNTVVSEWDLVCDRKWIPAFITSMQMVGVQIGSLFAGHLSDFCGRKPAVFLSLVITATFNGIGYFSKSWQMYTCIRMVIGIGMGCYLTVQYVLCIEFAPSKWRPLIVLIPSFAIEACLLALVAWLVPDWRNLHIVIAVIGAPFLLAWLIMPESIRWLVTRQRFADAEHVITVVSKVNRVKKPDLEYIITAVEEETTASEKKIYSLFDLFSSRHKSLVTVGLLFGWFASSCGYYGMAFGAKALAGSVYLNTFLLFIIDIPVLLALSYLVTRYGRKNVAVVFYVISGISGICVGLIKFTGSHLHESVVSTIMAMVAKLGVSGGSKAMCLLSVELYPTAIRTIAYGVLHTAANIGGMLAPQLVFLDDEIPGLLYFVCGVTILITSFIMLMFKETKDLALEDAIISQKKNKLDDEYKNIHEADTNSYNTIKKG